MIRFINIFFALALIAQAASAQNEPLTPADSALFLRVFKGYTATCILYNQNARTTTVWNAEEARKPYSPCSTFKIFNSMAAIDAGAIRDEYDTIRWDKKKKRIDDWERDHNLRSAIKYSVVWYYQELAARIGEAKMQSYLAKTGYGNMDMSGGLTKFWLESTLKISAEEQIAFLRRIPSYKLPFSHRSIDITKSIMIQEQQAGTVLYGKTGSGEMKKGLGQGWFVGWVERSGNRYYFAVHILGKKKAWGPKAKEIALEILRAKGILDPVTE